VPDTIAVSQPTEIPSKVINTGSSLLSPSAPKTPVLASSATASSALPPTPPLAAAQAKPVLNPARNPLALPPFLRDQSDMTAAIPSKALLSETTGSIGSARSRQSVSLHEAVSRAALSHPEIRAAEARVREAKSGIKMAESSLYLQGDTRLSLGGAQGGNAVGRSVYERTNPDGNARVDASVSLKQLIYDFGATRADVERTSYLRDAEKLKLLDKVDDIVLKTSQAYLKISEARALLSLVDETVASHRKLASIVQANQREGNGTAADVNRVNARVIDMTAIRSDVSLQMAGAEEQFHRLTKISPGALSQLPSLQHRLPKTPDEAVLIMKRNNPRLAAMAATASSVGKEIEFQRASQKPKFQLEVDSDTKNYAALNRHKNESEARALITMRYKFMDGGLGAATAEQLGHRRDASLLLIQNEDEQTSADIRQAYRAVDSARRKERLVSEGVRTSRKVQELYLEQFKAGRRTVFELLDSQMSSFTVRRSEIESRYEAQRATFDILRNTGRLAEAMSQTAGSRIIDRRSMGDADITTANISGTNISGKQARAKAPLKNAPLKTIATNDAATGQPETYPVSPGRMPKRIDEASLLKAASSASGRRPSI
jgi:outer membrane protein, adhesin transport system